MNHSGLKRYNSETKRPEVYRGDAKRAKANQVTQAGRSESLQKNRAELNRSDAKRAEANRIGLK